MSERWFYCNDNLCARNANGTHSGLIGEDELIQKFLEANGEIEPEFQTTMVASPPVIPADGITESLITITWVDDTQEAPASVTIIGCDDDGEAEFVVDLVEGVGTLAYYSTDATSARFDTVNLERNSFCLIEVIE